MTLVLPCLYSELAQPALAKIVQELSGVEYLKHIVIGLDRATEDEYKHALEYFSVLPQPHTVIWNDGPRMTSLQTRLNELGLAPTSLGKGCNVWYCFGFVQSLGDVQAVALHDCDISTYDRSMLARLFYPVANPRLTINFARFLCPGSRGQDEWSSQSAAGFAADPIYEASVRRASVSRLFGQLSLSPCGRVLYAY